MQALLKDAEIQHLTFDGTNYALAAGTSDVTSDYIDTANCEEVTILCVLGVMAASSTWDLKLQECDTSGGTYADLTGTAATQAVATDDDKVIGITIKKPLKRFLKVVSTRGDGGNATGQALLAIKRGIRDKPFTQSTAAGQFVAAPEFHLSPVAGTA